MNLDSCAQQMVAEEMALNGRGTASGRDEI